MITAEELVHELKGDEKEKSCFKLGKVVALFENKTAKIQFDGEDAPSEKQYAYLASYIPAVYDRVLLGAVGGTYIILGKINYDTPPEQTYDRYVFDEKQVDAQKGLKVRDGIDADSLIANVAEISGDLDIGGSMTADSVAANNVSSNGSIFANENGTFGGDVNCKNLSAGNNITGNIITANTTLRTDNIFWHNGSRLGFFGASTRTQITVNNVSSSADLAAVRSALYNLINALKEYGLIG